MSPQEELNAKVRKASEVQAKYANDLMRKPNVVGIAVGHPIRQGVSSPDVAVIVMVDHKVPSTLLAPNDIIPHELDGVPVDVQETGVFSAQ